MADLNLIPVFIVGLFGSVHCAGMCGGIVSAFSAVPPRRFPVPVITLGGGVATDAALRTLAYNGGRIASYASAGALAGGLAGGARVLGNAAALQLAGYWLANLMLVALGLYLMGAWGGLALLERAGQTLWRRLSPLMRFLLPLDSPLKMAALGALWGWLPCGMVYSVLMTAMFSGSAASGAAIMAAFGLGTLPMLISMAMLGERLRAAVGQRRLRLASGVVVLGFGLLGLLRAAGGAPHGWLDALCVSAGLA
ncbi:MAG: sulfite exporter TauE/SafE family protein [Massilia sp.]